jgi:hypothetical protein
MEDDEDIAAAMGFSAFGSSKKRKFDDTNSPKAKPGASSSGANITPLGVRSKTELDADAMDVTSQEQEPSTVEDSSILPQTQPLQRNWKGKQNQPAARGPAGLPSRGLNLPDKPQDSPVSQHPSSNADRPDLSEMISFGGPPVSRAELNALKQGVPDERGDMAYFLPSFVEDPWEKLGKHKK